MDDTDPSARDVRITSIRSTIKKLGILTTILSLVILVLGIPEVAIKTCTAFLGYIFCFSNSIAQAIWLSVMPLVSGIFGIIVGSKSASQQNVGILLGASIFGAVCSSVLCILQPLYASRTQSFYTYHTTNTALYAIQVVISISAAINLLLLIVSSCYSCCLCKYAKSPAPTVVYATA